MVYQRVIGGKLEIAETAVNTMLSLRQTDAHRNESGGILLGRILKACEDVVIDEVTRPLLGDRAGRLSFYRCRASTQERIIQAWHNSMHTENYLGEWHTHPEDLPEPSPKDLRNWEKIFRKGRFEQEFLFFVIVGRLSIRVWEQRRDWQSPVLLTKRYSP